MSVNLYASRRQDIPARFNLGISTKGKAMKTYTFDDPELGQISYRDNKRYLWLVAAIFPLIPFVGMGLVAWSGQQWTMWIPFVAVYLLVPLLDYVFENDATNPPEQVVPQLEADPYYRLLIYCAVPLHVGVLIGGAWFVANYDLGWFGLLGLSLAGRRCRWLQPQSRARTGPQATEARSHDGQAGTGRAFLRPLFTRA